MEERLASLRLRQDEEYFLDPNHLRVYVRRRGHCYTFDRRNISSISIYRSASEWAEVWCGLLLLPALILAMACVASGGGWWAWFYGTTAVFLFVLSGIFYFGSPRYRTVMDIGVPLRVYYNKEVRYPESLTLGWYRKKRYAELCRFAAQVNLQLKQLRLDTDLQQQGGVEFKSFDWLRAKLQDGLRELLDMLPQGAEEKVPVSCWDGTRYQPAFDETHPVFLLNRYAFVAPMLLGKTSPEEV